MFGVAFGATYDEREISWLIDPSELFSSLTNFTNSMSSRLRLARP